MFGVAAAVVEASVETQEAAGCEGASDAPWLAGAGLSVPTYFTPDRAVLSIHIDTFNLGDTEFLQRAHSKVFDDSGVEIEGYVFDTRKQLSDSTNVYNWQLIWHPASPIAVGTLLTAEVYDGTTLLGTSSPIAFPAPAAAFPDADVIQTKFIRAHAQLADGLGGSCCGWPGSCGGGDIQCYEGEGAILPAIAFTATQDWLSQQQNSSAPMTLDLWVASGLDTQLGNAALALDEALLGSTAYFRFYAPAQEYCFQFAFQTYGWEIGGVTSRCVAHEACSDVYSERNDVLAQCHSQAPDAARDLAQWCFDRAAEGDTPTECADAVLQPPVQHVCDDDTSASGTAGSGGAGEAGAASTCGTAGTSGGAAADDSSHMMAEKKSSGGCSMGDRPRGWSWFLLTPLSILAARRKGQGSRR